MNVSDDLVRAMYARYQEGQSLRDLEDEYGRSRQTIHRLFQRRGLPLRAVHNVPRLPWAPLARRLPVDWADADVAQLLNISRDALRRYRKAGTIPAELADPLAIAVGLHPLIVWGTDWTNALDTLEQAA